MDFCPGKRICDVRMGRLGLGIEGSCVFNEEGVGYGPFAKKYPLEGSPIEEGGS